MKVLLDLTQDAFPEMPEYILPAQSSFLIPCQKTGGWGGLKKDFKWAVLNIN
jgi:hypothetical protein